MKEIYLVHDQQESHWVRQHFLESAGYKVRSFESGSECYEALTDHVPDLIVMDVLIQGRNGFEVCRQLRRTYTAEQLPIVLCSEVYRSRLFQDEAANAGAQQYVLKPCRLDDLVQVIAEVLGVEAPAAAAAKPDAA